MGATLGTRIEPVEPAALGAEPEGPVPSPAQRPDDVVAEAGRIPDIPLVGDDPLPVVPVQSALGAEPDEARRVLQDAPDRTLGQSLRRGDPLAQQHLPVRCRRPVPLRRGPGGRGGAGRQRRRLQGQAPA